MSKGGGGGSNDQAIAMQRQAAAEAREKEQKREERLRQGTKAIDEMFGGRPVTAKRQATYDLSQFNPSATFSDDYYSAPVESKLPKGFKYRKRAANPEEISKREAKALADRGPPIDYGQSPEPEHGRAYQPLNYSTETYEIVGPNGQVIAFGENPEDLRKGGQVQYEEEYDTGSRTGGIGPEFYDKYRKTQADYYYPEVDKQFAKAKEQTAYGHANAGTLQSSVAGDNAADILAQNVTNRSQIGSQIEDTVGQLRRQVASDKSALINQLYATENPEMAANEALARVRTINQQSPALSPLGDMFRTAAIGLGGAMGAYGDPMSNVRRTGQSGDAGRYYNV